MNDELTEKQKGDIARAKNQIVLVRGLQAAILGLSLYLAIFEKRGLTAVLIGAGIALCYQFAAVPVLPRWMEKRRPDDED